MDWQPSAYDRRLLLIGTVGVLAAALFGRPAYAVLAAAPLWLAFTARGTPADRIAVSIDVDHDRCFEGDVLTVTAQVRADGPVTMAATLTLPAGLHVVDDDPRWAIGVRERQFQWSVRAEQWGRCSLGPVVIHASRAGLLSAVQVRSPTPTLSVFPYAAALHRPPLPRTMPNRLGDHVSRATGDGLEFAGVRPQTAGESLRHLNWRATARYGRPFLTQVHAERACELVIVVDALGTDAVRHRGSLDRSVRGATSLARAYLDAHDRVGVLTLGGVLRWVTVQSGPAQFYAVLDTLLDIRPIATIVRPDVQRLPRRVLPAGAMVVLFSPLLDDRTAEAARELRERRHPLIVIDVLTDEPRLPATGPASDLALRLWRLQRTASRGRLTDIGAHVLPWGDALSVDDILAALPDGGRLA